MNRSWHFCRTAQRKMPPVWGGTQKYGLQLMRIQLQWGIFRGCKDKTVFNTTDIKWHLKKNNSCNNTQSLLSPQPTPPKLHEMFYNIYKLLTSCYGSSLKITLSDTTTALIPPTIGAYCRTCPEATAQLQNIGSCMNESLHQEIFFF